MAESSAEQAKNPAAEHRRWQRELQLAEKREKDWRKFAEKVVKIYKGVERKKNSFNILAANTETLRPALYSSLPKPDVRRRFRDSDPIGKAVSEVMERALSVSVDHYDFDECCRYDVLDALLPGRGVSRIRYVPQMRPGEETEDESGESEQVEEVEYEQVVCEHVDWQDLRIGYGRVWAETEWVAFRHRMQKADVREKLGDEVADELKYDEEKDESNGAKSDWDQVNSEITKTAEIWEIWDKPGERVFFLSDNVKRLIFPVDNPDGAPPLDLERFFPIPEPLRLFEDSSSQIPTPIYDLYKDQAEELERLSGRITRIINALKVRGVYDATMKEIGDLMKGDDNDMIPASNAAKWQQAGGIEKAIWWMPVQQVASVLRELYAARESCKQVIYELTGISDIVRGQTNANETLGAQQLKSNYSTMRLKRMQIAVQGYIRDLIRMMAEVIGEKFSTQTLAKMTGLSFPDAEQKQAAQMQMAQMQQQGQPVQQDMQQMIGLPTWEEIRAVLSDDMLRTYRVDVETDSTVQGILQEDMTALRDVLTGIVQFWQGAGPAVQAGAVPIEAVKAITLSIARRSKLGLEVEDALEKMKAPEPTPQQSAPPDHTLEAAQVSAQADTQAAQLKAQAEAQSTQFKAQAEANVEQMRIEGENQRERMRLEFDSWKAELEASTRVTVAQISAKSSLDQTLMSAQQAANTKVADDLAGAQKPDPLAGIAQMHGQALQAIENLARVHAAPKRVIYGPNGRPEGVESVIQN